MEFKFKKLKPKQETWVQAANLIIQFDFESLEK